MDDEKPARTYIRLMFERNPPEGFEQWSVIEACDGVEALELLRAEPADIMLMDIRMPRMDGIALLEHVRALLPGMPVIVLSAHSEFSYAQTAIKFGVCDYVLKPIDDEQLFAALAKAADEIAADQDAKGHYPAQVLVMQYLQEHFKEDINLESIASALNFSPKYLSRIFIDSYGKRFSESLTDMRLAEAARLLREGLLRVNRIAAMTGYPDEKYFSRVFRKKYHMSPNEYKQKH